MVAEQGDVYWVRLAAPIGSEPGYTRPCVIIQNNVMIKSRINTILVCTISSNLKLTNAPGNVLLAEGEANLDKSSVVNVSQVVTVNKVSLLEKIGHLSQQRVIEIISGLHLLIDPKDTI